MSFLVEDGTGVAEATSYVTVAEADEFFQDTGRSTEWGTNVSLKQEALVRGSLYVDQVFSARFLGSRLSRAQGLHWPRENVCLDGEEIPIDEIPVELKRGVMEYTFDSFTDELLPNPPSPALKLERTKIDVIEEEIERFPNVSDEILPRPAGDTWINKLLRSLPGRVIR